MIIIINWMWFLFSPSSQSALEVPVPEIFCTPWVVAFFPWKLSNFIITPFQFKSRACNNSPFDSLRKARFCRPTLWKGFSCSPYSVSSLIPPFVNPKGHDHLLHSPYRIPLHLVSVKFTQHTTNPQSYVSTCPMLFVGLDFLFHVPYCVLYHQAIETY